MMHRQRIKRFALLVELEDGSTVTAYSQDNRDATLAVQVLIPKFLGRSNGPSPDTTFTLGGIDSYLSVWHEPGVNETLDTIRREVLP